MRSEPGCEYLELIPAYMERLLPRLLGSALPGATSPHVVSDEETAPVGAPPLAAVFSACRQAQKPFDHRDNAAGGYNFIEMLDSFGSHTVVSLLCRA